PANVTPINVAPLLPALSDQVLLRGQDQIVLSLQGTDANGDALSYSARVVGQNVLTQAGQLDQSLGLSFMGSYYTNFQGHNEKWLQGADAQYFLLPNGELRRWHDMQSSYGPAGLVATLGANFYANPELLWNPASVLSVSGNQLTIHRPGGLS